jgi:hypothetical protein
MSREVKAMTGTTFSSLVGTATLDVQPQPA